MEDNVKEKIQAKALSEIQLDGENAPNLIKAYRKKYGTNLAPTDRCVRMALREIRTGAAVNFIEENGKDRNHAIRSLMPVFFTDPDGNLKATARIVDDALARLARIKEC